MSFEITQVSDSHNRDFIRNRTAVVISIDNELLDRVIESSEIDETDAKTLGDRALTAAAGWRAEQRIQRAMMAKR